MKKIYILKELEFAQSKLEDDIQRLSHIQQEVENAKKQYLENCVIENSIDKLLKSMIFYQAEMKDRIQVIKNKN